MFYHGTMLLLTATKVSSLCVDVLCIKARVRNALPATLFCAVAVNSDLSLRISQDFGVLFNVRPADWED